MVQTSSGTGLSVWSILVRLSVCAMHEHIDLLQVAIATGVANEALSNVRTVRAFAMEEKETR